MKNELLQLYFVSGINNLLENNIAQLYKNNNNKREEEEEKNDDYL